MHFFTKDEIEELFKNFASLNIDEIIESHENELYYDKNYIIKGVKK